MGSFCENAKKEILGATLHSRKAKTAFLSAVFASLGTLQFSNGQKGFSVRFSETVLKEKVTALLDELYKNGAEVWEEHSRISVSGSFFYKLLTDLRLFYKDESGELSYIEGIHPDLTESADSRLGYIRGMFVSAGSVTVSSGYHLEFHFFNGFLAADLQKVLAESGFQFSTLSHKEKTIIYIKDNEAVSDFLAFLGAGGAVMELCGIFAQRSADKLINRRINCDIANIDKTVASAASQIEAINFLKQTGQLKKLAQKLQDTAALRLKFPESSLADLAACAGITKSGLRHRLDKIMKYACEIQNPHEVL